MEIEVEVSNLFLTTSETSGVSLREKDGHRTLQVLLGDFEAQSIMLGLNGIDPPRPLTHDLSVKLLEKSNILIQKLVITKLKSNTFYGELHIDSEGIHSVIDTRPSDGIAFAVRLGFPVFVEEELFDLSNYNEEETKDFIKKSLESLHSELESAVKNENYEAAAKIRDKILTLKKKLN